MKKSKVAQYPVGTPEYVVAHAKRQASCGRRPSVPYLWERNPRQALCLALAALKNEMSMDDFSRGMYHIVRTSFTREEALERIRVELGYQGPLAVLGGDDWENGLEPHERDDQGEGIRARQALFDEYAYQSPRHYVGTMLRNGAHVEVYAGEKFRAVFPSPWPDGSHHGWKVRRAQCELCKTIPNHGILPQLHFAKRYRVHRCHACGQRWYGYEISQGTIWARIVDDQTWATVLWNPYRPLELVGRHSNAIVRIKRTA